MNFSKDAIIESYKDGIFDSLDKKRKNLSLKDKCDYANNQVVKKFRKNPNFKDATFFSQGKIQKLK